MRRTSPLFIAGLVLIVALVGVEVLFHPRLAVHTGIKLNGPPHEKAVTLLDERRPLRRFRKRSRNRARALTTSGVSAARCCTVLPKTNVWMLPSGCSPRVQIRME